MNALLRALPLALVLTGVASAAETLPVSNELPSIFSDVAPRSTWVTRPLSVPEISRPRAPMSEQMRTRLMEQANVRPGILPIAARPAARSWVLDHGDAIVMENYVVNVPPEKKVEIERTPNSLYRMFATGQLYTFSERLGAPQLMWSLGHVRAPAIGSASTAPRVEITLSWHW